MTGRERLIYRTRFLLKVIALQSIGRYQGLAYARNKVGVAS